MINTSIENKVNETRTRYKELHDKVAELDSEIEEAGIRSHYMQDIPYFTEEKKEKARKKYLELAEYGYWQHRDLDDARTVYDKAFEEKQEYYAKLHAAENG